MKSKCRTCSQDCVHYDSFFGSCKHMKQKQQIIYYNEHGEIDKFATYINNHDWCLPVVFILGLLLTGLIEGL